MKYSNFAVITCLIIGLVICWTAAQAQQQYPSTGHSEFTPADAWSVSTPDEFDQSKSPNSDMSPDHWGSSASLDNPLSYQTEQTWQAWDGNLENHPWIKADEIPDEEIVNSNADSLRGDKARAPTMSVRSNKDTNAEIPLPPSAIRLPDTPAYPLESSTPETTYPAPIPNPPSTGNVDPDLSKPNWPVEAIAVPHQNWPEMEQPASQPEFGNSHQPTTNSPIVSPNFRPDLGQRSPTATFRAPPTHPDFGQQYGYEKQQHPPLSEILATGRYVGSVDLMTLKPYFQGNSAIATSNGFVAPFDFNHEFAWSLSLGFESKLGPGVKLDYFQFDQDSNTSSFTSNGTISGTTSVWMLGPSQWSRLTASNAGESLNADHSLEVHLASASFFKELKFKISRLTGSFGIQYASITQEMNSVLTNSGGAEIGRLTATSDMDAYGPNVGFEYFRPIGHTRLEIFSAFGGALLFGNRAQRVQNSSSGDVSRIGADEFIAKFDIGTGVQSHRYFGENRSVYWKVEYVAQTWINGGTGTITQDDFGFRGFSFSLGLNR